MAIEDRTNTTEIDKNLVPPENQDTKPENTAPQSGDSYEVRINSYKVVSALGITAVHNEIAFYRNGEALVAFNGNAHDRQSGHSQAFTISQGNTLKVSAMDKTFESIGMERVASASFGKIDRETFVEKLKAATQASQWINKNDVEYVVIGGLGFEAQNSNSVASSLTQAMGRVSQERT